MLLWIRPLIKLCIPITTVNSKCGININVLFQIRYKYVKKDIFYRVQWKKKTGLKSDQYTISVLKLVNRGVETGTKEEPVLNSQKGICLQCGNSLIPRLLKLNPRFSLKEAHEPLSQLSRRSRPRTATCGERTGDRPRSELTVFVTWLLWIRKYSHWLRPE